MDPLPLVLGLAVGLLAVLTAGCSDAALQPLPPDVATVDASLSVEGRFCTSPPGEVGFPVKILLVVDQSASLQCTDPGNARLAALDAAARELDGLPDVQFGVVGFASWSRETAFSSDWADVVDALAPERGQGGPATDYQGALSTALRVLEQDMAAASPAENARARYVVLFLSDGVPEPRCRAGCDDGDSLPDSLYGVCNTSRELPEGEYVGMTSACQAYNQPPQLLDGVADLVALGARYGVASVRVDTVLLFAPDDQIAAVCGDVTGFGYVREEAEPLLRDMAAVGGGTFRDLNTSATLDALEVTHVEVAAPWRLTEVLALHTRALETPEGLVADSDGDGLTDAEELALGTDALAADSDRDGWGDRLEQAHADRGLDPRDAAVPAWGCADAEDRDGDGLAGCEEDWLGTDALLADSDGDRMPDGVEVRLGTDPVVADAHDDPDRDGLSSLDELRAVTHPRVHTDELARLRAARVGVTPGPTQPDGSRCHDWRVSELTQVVPRARDDGKGTNRVLILATEEPEGLGVGRGRHHVACVESRYLGPSFKAPESGRITGLGPEHFHELALFDPRRHCLRAPVPGEEG